MKNARIRSSNVCSQISQSHQSQTLNLHHKITKTHDQTPINPQTSPKIIFIKYILNMFKNQISEIDTENYLNKQGSLSSVPQERILSYKLEIALNPHTLTPTIQDFRKIIQEDTVLRMYFNDQVLQTLPQYEKQNKKYRLLGDTVDEAMELLNKAILAVPCFENSEIIGIPIYSLFVDYLQTKPGQAFFGDQRVNQKLKAIMDFYGKLLDQPESLRNFEGWISPEALKYWNPDEWILDKNQKYYGFKCWHDFFLRKFKQEKRPVAEGQDIIANVCQSTPLTSPRMPVRNVQKKDKFWLKEGRYSLVDMVGPNFNSHIDDFVGGTVYQGFLSPWYYHRCHSPIQGQILQAELIPGNYFLQNPNVQPVQGEDSYCNSQPFLCCTAARLVILIQSKDYGKIFVILVGMNETSSCVFSNPELPLPRKVSKGEQIGYFKYGGSSHAIIFDNTFDVELISPGPHPDVSTLKDYKMNVRSPLARVKSKPKN